MKLVFTKIFVKKKLFEKNPIKFARNKLYLKKKTKKYFFITSILESDRVIIKWKKKTNN